MNEQTIKSVKAATIAIGYTDGSGVPLWLGTGFLLGNGEGAVTCNHVVEGRKRFIEIDGKKLDLRCFLFWVEKGGFRVFQLPITAILATELMEIKSTFYGGLKPDVAYLKLDFEHWKQIYSDQPLPKLEIESSYCGNVGEDIIVAGFPSPHLLIAQSTGTPNAIEPLVQFGKVAGVLPAAVFPQPHSYALDMIAAPGSSGSPVVRLLDGKVIGIVSEMLPGFWKKEVKESTTHKTEETKQLAYPIPTGITYAVPSPYFAHFTKGTGDGEKFDIHPQI